MRHVKMVGNAVLDMFIVAYILNNIYYAHWMLDYDACPFAIQPEE